MAANLIESKLIISTPEYATNLAAQVVWENLFKELKGTDGIYYYKHPIIGSQSGLPADFCLLPKGYQPIAIRCISCNISEIENVGEEIWKINSQPLDSPLAELDDFAVALESKFKKDRDLRRVFSPITAIIFSNITKTQFNKKFPKFKADASLNCSLIWKGESVSTLFKAITLTDIQWQLAQAIFQSTSPLNRKVILDMTASDKIGEAIKLLDRRIAILDDVQHRTTVQIPPGPQRIRGLAGTGKTILLAMRAAFIHQRFPDAKILFTFHTQSLYNQAKALITKFYRDNAETDPNWDNLHIRHGWGGSVKSGVYWDTCMRLGIPAINFMQAKAMDNSNPLGNACALILNQKIEPYYDFILVDEAQDFPKEFFRLLYKLSKESHRIYWAYDELQNLSATDIPSLKDWFGTDEQGKPLVSLDGDYPGDMEKDVVLNKSYRCPLKILMLAHGIGLGIYSTKGCVQMVPDLSTWKALGYELESGEIKAGSNVVLNRPEENSPSQINAIYSGKESLIQILKRNSREEELGEVARVIIELVGKESVAPHHIVVVSLDSRHAREHLGIVQRNLLKGNVQSVVPGFVDGSSEFGEEGKVTLSTVYRAKGNEAPIVFIVCFDAIYDYVDEVENRNKAFTSISRAKGWVKISGCGEKMQRAKEEILRITHDVPKFKFKFPSMEKIKCLGSAETTRRKKEHQKMSETLKQLLHADEEVLKSLNPKQRADLLDKLRKMQKQ